jgi:NAD(P)-dependent dehydrogenase (short-subunit alcohol dehydrogenase family)
MQMQQYLVIGASSGIGLKLAELLEHSGHKVFGTYFRHEMTSRGGYSSDYHFLDVKGKEFNFDFLPESLDGLVYCPGSINLKPFHRIKPEEFVEDYQLQVVGAVKSIQAVLPRLKKSVSASIVLFSTVAVQSGFNFHSQVSASKGAIEGLTRALAAELVPSIRVNCIALSLTDTPLADKLLNTEEKKVANAQRHPLKRIGTPEDIAHMAEFLLSEKSSWITGQVLHVDGGISTLKV